MVSYRFFILVLQKTHSAKFFLGDTELSKSLHTSAAPPPPASSLLTNKLSSSTTATTTNAVGSGVSASAASALPGMLIERLLSLLPRNEQPEGFLYGAKC